MAQGSLMALHLTIHSVQKANEGIYSCVISNHAGTEISKEAQLSVGKKSMQNMYSHNM